MYSHTKLLRRTHLWKKEITSADRRSGFSSARSGRIKTESNDFSMGVKYDKNLVMQYLYNATNCFNACYCRLFLGNFPSLTEVGSYICMLSTMSVGISSHACLSAFKLLFYFSRRCIVTQRNPFKRCRINRRNSAPEHLRHIKVTPPFVATQMGNHKLGSSLTNVGFESIKSIIAL